MKTKNDNAVAVADRLLSIKDTADRLGVSTRTLYRMFSAGEFPSPVKTGPTRHGSRCRESDVASYLERITRERR